MPLSPIQTTEFFLSPTHLTEPRRVTEWCYVQQLAGSAVFICSRRVFTISSLIARSPGPPSVLLLIQHMLWLRSSLLVRLFLLKGYKFIYYSFWIVPTGRETCLLKWQSVLYIPSTTMEGRGAVEHRQSPGSHSSPLLGPLLAYCREVTSRLSPPAFLRWRVGIPHRLCRVESQYLKDL